MNRLVRTADGRLVATRRHGEPPPAPFGYIPSERDKYTYLPNPEPCAHRIQDKVECCNGGTKTVYSCGLTNDRITLDGCITCGRA
jgi:hypothetical protein